MGTTMIWIPVFVAVLASATAAWAHVHHTMVAGSHRQAVQLSGSAGLLCELARICGHDQEPSSAVRVLGPRKDG